MIYGLKLKQHDIQNFDFELSWFGKNNDTVYSAWQLALDCQQYLDPVNDWWLVLVITAVNELIFARKGDRG